MLGQTPILAQNVDIAISINVNVIMNNNIFWHICGINNWKQIVRDQIATIISSKLISIIDNIYVTYLGQDINDIDWLKQINKKIIIQNYNKNILFYEKLCLDSLFEWSKNNSSNVLYIHAKGVSRPNNHNVWNWRKMMEYFLIDKHEICIEKLNSGYDTVGCLLINAGTNLKIKDENHKYHYSGNFWWSKTDYIKTLPNIPNINLSVKNNCWICERWILYHYHNNKHYIMYDNLKKHYYLSSPKNYKMT